MTDVKEQIKNYIKQQKGRATIPEIQLASGLSFKDVHEAVNKLCEEGKVCLTDGLYYEIQPEKTILQSMSEHQRRWQELGSGFLSVEEDDGNDDDDDEDGDSFEDAFEEDIRQRRLALEQRRRELIERMRRVNEQSHRQEEENDDCDDFAKNTKDGKVQEENTEETAELQNTVEEKGGAATLQTASENTSCAHGLADALTAVIPVQRLANSLNDINPVTRLANVISGIAAKKECEQSGLSDARRRLAVVLHNIAAAQDDNLRNGGRSYSEEYFEAFNKTIGIMRITGNKYEIYSDKVLFANKKWYYICLIYVGNKTYLTDDGRVYYWLSQRIGSARAKRKIEKHTQSKSWIKFEDGKLYMPTSVKHSVGDYFSMYYAMRSLLETF